ncbi:MAG: hypothetical protein D6725_02455 [Planctomycetota bacterium]|nr:MAG: hypothetical protein D6725_02455 [Planctomycetota bacterium]
MGRVERTRELARRRHRREKLKKLRQKFRAAKSDAERQAIIEKVRKISPFVNLEAEEQPR